MVTVVYTAHRLRSSEVQCYVDGVLSLTAEVTLPLQEEVRYPYKILLFYILFLDL